MKWAKNAIMEKQPEELVNEIDKYKKLLSALSLKALQSFLDEVPEYFAMIASKLAENSDTTATVVSLQLKQKTCSL